MEPQYRRSRPDLGCSAIGWMDSKYSLRPKQTFLSCEVNSSSLLDNHGLQRVVSLQDVHLEGAS
jgi:hypothetical protein